MRILGIESSCDESAVSVIEVDNDQSRRVIVEYIATHDNQSYGGVIPESSARQHFYFCQKMIEKLQAEIDLQTIDLICGTYAPGLIGGLMLGTATGQVLSVVLNKPFFLWIILKAHALSPMFENDEITFPYVCLLVSGGHTLLLEMQSFEHMKVLSSTRDDAMGELFDKVAVCLGLGFPGGRAIEQLSKNGDPRKYSFKLPVCKDGEYGTALDFSFSGLKTAFMRQIEKIKLEKGELDEADKADIAACLQYVVGEICKEKFQYIAANIQSDYWCIAGGVGSNQYIRKICTELAAKNNKKIFFPSLKLCTDNATMIAWAGFLSKKYGVGEHTLCCSAKSSLGY